MTTTLRNLMNLRVAAEHLADSLADTSGAELSNWGTLGFELGYLKRVTETAVCGPTVAKAITPALATLAGVRNELLGLADLLEAACPDLPWPDSPTEPAYKHLRAVCGQTHEQTLPRRTKPRG